MFVRIGLKEADLFTTSKKQGKLVERYKISFDRAGDADLESCNDVKVIASLLKLWLNDLPHPLIPQRLSSRLTGVFHSEYKRIAGGLVYRVANSYPVAVWARLWRLLFFSALIIRVTFPVLEYSNVRTSRGVWKNFLVTGV